MNKNTQSFYEPGKEGLIFQALLTHEGLAYSASMSKESKAYKLGCSLIERNRHENK